MRLVSALPNIEETDEIPQVGEYITPTQEDEEPRLPLNDLDGSAQCGVAKPSDALGDLSASTPLLVESEPLERLPSHQVRTTTL
jgi:hypothetical protein